MILSSATFTRGAVISCGSSSDGLGTVEIVGKIDRSLLIFEMSLCGESEDVCDTLGCTFIGMLLGMDNFAHWTFGRGHRVSKYLSSDFPTTQLNFRNVAFTMASAL